MSYWRMLLEPRLKPWRVVSHLDAWACEAEKGPPADAMHVGAIRIGYKGHNCCFHISMLRTLCGLDARCAVGGTHHHHQRDSSLPDG